ncbi:33028_t:CDS:2, partial [Racocetra persica]
NQSYNAIEKDQGSENQVLDPNFQKQPAGNSQLNPEITIEESVAQSSSFDIEEDNAIKGSNLSDDTDASVSVKKPLNHEENGDPSDEYSDSAEEAEEQRFDTLTSMLTKSNDSIKKNKSKINKNLQLIVIFLTYSKLKVNYDPVDDSIKRISSDLTDNSLPSISEILPPLIRNNSSTLSHSNNIKKDVVDSDRNDVQAISSIINSQKNLPSNNNPLNNQIRKPEMKIENASSYLVPIVLIDNNSV